MGGYPDRQVKADVDVVFQAQAPELKEPDALEEAALAAFDVLEEDVSELAIGAAVAVDLENAAVEIKFCVEAATKTAAEQKVDQVVRALDPVFKQHQVSTSTAPLPAAAGVCL